MRFKSKLLNRSDFSWTTALLCCWALSVNRKAILAVAVAALLYAFWKARDRGPDVLRMLRGFPRSPVSKQPPLPHLLLFVAVLAGLMPFSTNVEVSLLHFLRTTLFLGTSFLALVCLRQLSPQRRRAHLVVHAILLGDVVDAVYGLYQVHATGHMHVMGFSSNNNYVYFGSLLVQAVLLAMALLLAAHSPLRRAAYFGIVVICGAALVCSQARGPWVALAVSCPVVIALSWQSFARDRAWARLCLGATVVLALALAPLYVGHLLTIINPKWESNWERILIWRSTLHMIQDYPLTGVGNGQFAAIYNARYISPASVERWHPHAHNSFLQMMAENGILGLAASLYLLYGVGLFLRVALRETPSDPYVIGTVGVFCALFVCSLFDLFFFSYFVRSEWVFWLLLGLVYYERPDLTSYPAQTVMPQAMEHKEQTLA